MSTGDLRQAILQAGHRDAVMNGEIETVNRVLDFRTIGGIYAGLDKHYMGQGY